MKTVLALLLLLSFAGISTFGVVGIHNDHDHSHTMNCIAATIAGETCPTENNPLAFLSFHLDTLKSFSATIFESGFSVFLLALLITASGVTLHINTTPPPLRMVYTSHWGKSFGELPLYTLTKWLALHENSPTISF